MPKLVDFFTSEPFLYGNWAGGGYSAGGPSAPFIPYTDNDLAVPPVDGFDGFAYIHDNAYEQAQQTLLQDIARGVSAKDAYISYFTTLKNADADFASKAPTGDVLNVHGVFVRAIGAPVMDLLSILDTAILERLNDASDPLASEYGSYITPAQAQKVLDANNAYKKHVQDHSNDVAGIAEKRALAEKAIKDVGLDKRLGTLDLLGDALTEDPSLLAKVIIELPAMAAFVVGAEVTSWAGALANAVSGTIDNVGNFISNTFFNNGSVNYNPEQFSQFVKGLNNYNGGNVTGYLKDIMELTVIDNTNYFLKPGDIIEAVTDAGGTALGPRVKVVTVNTGNTFSLVSDDITTTIAGKSYLATDILDSMKDAADSVGKFVSDAAAYGTNWFSSTTGAGTSFASWLAGNIQSLVDGTITSDAALISLAKHLGQDYITGFVGSQVGSTAAANDNWVLAQRRGA